MAFSYQVFVSCVYCRYIYKKSVL